MPELIGVSGKFIHVILLKTRTSRPKIGVFVAICTTGCRDKEAIGCLRYEYKNHFG